jgi:hypothetical protein
MHQLNLIHQRLYWNYHKIIAKQAWKLPLTLQRLIIPRETYYTQKQSILD